MTMRADATVGEAGGVTRIGPFSSVPELLRSMGTDPASLVESVGLDLRMFEDPDHTIPFVTAGRLLQVCAERTGCPHFGLLMGQRSGFPRLGWSAHSCSTRRPSTRLFGV